MGIWLALLSSSVKSLSRPRYKNTEKDGIALLGHRFNRQYKDTFIKLGFSALGDALVSTSRRFSHTAADIRHHKTHVRAPAVLPHAGAMSAASRRELSDVSCWCLVRSLTGVCAGAWRDGKKGL